MPSALAVGMLRDIGERGCAFGCVPFAGKRARTSVREVHRIIVTAYTVMACTMMAYMVMAYTAHAGVREVHRIIVMACTVMAYSRSGVSRVRRVTGHKGLRGSAITI